MVMSSDRCRFQITLHDPFIKPLLVDYYIHVKPQVHTASKWLYFLYAKFLHKDKAFNVALLMFL